MFNLFGSTFTLIVSTPGVTSADGVAYSRTETSTTIECRWADINTASLKISGGRVVEGELQTGDATAMVKDSALDWTVYAHIPHRVERSGIKYRISSTSTRPRGWTSINLKRLEG